VEDFVGAKLHVLADRNQRVQIREKMLEFSSVLSTPSSYLLFLSRKVSKVIYKKNLYFHEIFGIN